MKTHVEAPTGLDELFFHELQDIYDAEKQMVTALPKMTQAAASPALAAAFTDHLVQTQTHVERLEAVFESLGIAKKGVPCPGMEGLIEEGEEMIDQEFEDATRDAGLIGAAQKMEHYEIAAYGTLIAHALRLGYTEDAGLLRQTLGEEKETDLLLSDLAASEVNGEAEDGTDEDEGDASI